MDIEWALDESGQFFIVQARPETYWSVKGTEKSEGVQSEEIGEVLTKGLPASPGIGCGKVRIIHSADEIDKVQKGEVLVTEMTNPDMVPAMQRASAIVTQEGGMTCIHGDTYVLTDKGFIKAKDLYEKIKNNPYQKIKIFSYDYKNKSFVFKDIIAAGKNVKDNLVEIQVGKRNADRLKITLDHKFYTFKNKEFVKIPLEKILEDSLCVSIPKEISGLNENVILDNDLCYILGLMITDGYIKLTNRRGYVCLSQKMEGARVEIINKYSQNVSDKNYNFILHSKEFASKINKYVEKLDYYVLRMSNENLKHFIAGVLDGDGSYNNKRINIYLDPRKETTKSVILALYRLGIEPQVTKNRNIWNIQITTIDSSILLNACRFKNVPMNKEDKKYFQSKEIGITKYEYTRNDCLISSKKLKELNFTDILKYPITQKRAKLTKYIGKSDVYNFEVNADNEMDKNYVVFTEGFMPILVSNSHAAIVSRELGIPCVVGVQDIFEVVKEGIEVTVNGYTGEIIKGIVKKEEKEKVSSESKEVVNVIPEIITATNIMMNLGVPEKAEEYAKLPCDGIGLMRMEFILASKIKIHPLKAIKEGKEQEYVDKLAENIEKVVRAFYPRPVILRFSDFKSNEYKDLPGGEEFEPKENNPMIGFRGCYRYIHPMFKKAFELEIEAVKKVREKGLKNLWVMVPFVRRIKDIQKVRKILEEKGLLDDPTMKLFIMAEVPSVALQIDEFCKYCDGFSIGSNDLTQLTLGVDRDSQIVAFDYEERDEGVKIMVKMAVEGAKRNNKYSGLCGQAPSDYPEFAEFLVSIGIESMSLNPDSVLKIIKDIAEMEKDKK